MKHLLVDIKLAVGRELRRANEKFGVFNSMHEGYAVIKEEIEESDFELKLINRNLENLWHCAKTDNLIGAYELAKDIEEYAINLAAEACQVAAMARKFQALKNTPEKNADVTGEFQASNQGQTVDTINKDYNINGVRD